MKEEVVAKYVLTSLSMLSAPCGATMTPALPVVVVFGSDDMSIVAKAVFSPDREKTNLLVYVKR